MTVLAEAEAKLKSCPLTFQREAWLYCMGSQCLAWRWSRAKDTRAYLDAVQERMKTTNENFNIATNKVWAERGPSFEKIEGYCGQFGRPE